MNAYVEVQCRFPDQTLKKEFFLLNEECKLDLSEVSLLFGSPLYETALIKKDEKEQVIGVLECDSTEITRKSFTPGSTVYINPSADELIHGSHECARCGTKPITGPRYYCSECVYSFSLCSDCYSNNNTNTTNDHEHDINKLEKLDKVIYANFWLGGPTLIQTIMNIFNNYEPLTCVGYEDLPLQFKWITYSNLKDRFIHFASGLSSFLELRSHVGIYATNKVEWLVADLACVYSAYVSVYMHYPTDTDALIFLVNDANLKAIICESSQQILEIAANIPSVKLIVQTNNISESEKKLAETANIKLITFNELEQIGSKQVKPPKRAKSEELGTITYTSGSTGNPKGVMFTYGSMNEYLRGSITAVDPTKTVLMEYLPLSHTRGAFRHCFLYGGVYVLCNRGLQDVFEIARIINPTRFRGVPVVWNKLYDEYQNSLKLAKESGLSEEAALKSVKESYSGILGNRMIRVSTGSAPTSPVVKQFLIDCFEQVIDAYGCTEAGAISANNRIITGSEVKIISCEELGYKLEDKPYPRGEVVVRTSSMASGYYNNPTATSSSFTEDGYFLTGDIVEQRGDEFVLIDRKKNFFKLSNGKFVRCEYLENLFSKSEYIHQIFISGDPLQDYVLAVVVPTDELINNLGEDESAIKKLITHSIVKIALEHKIPHYETPKGLVIERKAFSIEDGTLTPNYKKARVALQTKYRRQLKYLYSTADPSVDVTIDYLKSIMDDTFGSQGSTNDYFSSASDSISKMMLVSKLKTHFAKEIPLSVAFQSMTVEDVAKLILKPDKEDHEEKQFIRDLALPTPIVTEETTPPKPFDIFENNEEGKSKTLLLTGATGFVGTFLLAELLRRTPMRIACLVRPTQAGDAGTHGKARILRALRRLRVDVDEKEVEARVVEVGGELGNEKMGMGEEVWERMAREVDVIVHCAASVNWILPYSKQRVANVLGTLSILELATSFKTKPLCFLSTLSVTRVTNDPTLCTLQTFMQTPAYDRKDGYIMSKWMSEYLVRQTTSKGLPTIIIRPGMVTGHSIHGGIPESQFMSRVLRGIILMKSAPLLANIITDLTPVDFVAVACTHILRHELIAKCEIGRNRVKCYHLWNDRFISFLDIAECFRFNGFNIEDVAYDKWLAQINKSNPKKNPVYALAQFLPKETDGITRPPPNFQLPTIHSICDDETSSILDLSVQRLLTTMIQFVTSE